MPSLSTVVGNDAAGSVSWPIWDNHTGLFSQPSIDYFAAAGITCPAIRRPNQRRFAAVPLEPQRFFSGRKLPFPPRESHGFVGNACNQAQSHADSTPVLHLRRLSAPSSPSRSAPPRLEAISCFFRLLQPAFERLFCPQHRRSFQVFLSFSGVSLSCNPLSHKAVAQCSQND